MQPHISSKGFDIVYVFVVPAFCQRWPVRLDLIDTKGGGGSRSPRRSLGSLSTAGLGVWTRIPCAFLRLTQERRGRSPRTSSGYLSPGGPKDASGRIYRHFLLSVTTISATEREQLSARLGVCPAGVDWRARPLTCSGIPGMRNRPGIGRLLQVCAGFFLEPGRLLWGGTSCFPESPGIGPTSVATERAK